jgi:hypothetical protein
VNKNNLLYDEVNMNSLYIAVIALNYRLSCEAIRFLAENDTNATIKQAHQNIIQMSDGTVYRCFSDYNQVRGHCIDQLILVDDSRWYVVSEQDELISCIHYRMMHSCVPEELKIQKFEW